ncbi:hypothetical protein PR003_g8985 [Phytophthora rubi]|uniref:Uncharacterized protein n=1 Tax=Phytophthora rubi TaxID=129364 RepID=A0A6A4FTP5_9STRA|nr:hypothetical protein PR003_g8985 [Phytophthora rubi]
MAPVEYDVVVDADTYSFAAAMLACSSEEGAIAWVMKVGLLAPTAAWDKFGGAMQRNSTTGAATAPPAVLSERSALRASSLAPAPRCRSLSRSSSSGPTGPT